MSTVADPPHSNLERSPFRAAWLFGTVGLTALGFGAAIALAPPGVTPPAKALTALLFIGSSMHVASTGWFATVADVRAQARSHPRRYLIAPAALVAGAIVLTIAVPPDKLLYLLLGYYAWQFFHFQKQNVGMVALAGVSHGAGSATRYERWAITATGVAGIAALVVHPDLLQLDIDAPARAVFPVALGVYLVAVVGGLVVFARRDRSTRPAALAVVYVMALLFFAPVFAFSSPYAAVAGLTIAHGLQYLLIVGLVVGGEHDPQRRLVGFFVLFNIALLGGGFLAASSHLHDADGAARALYGVFLGLTMAHFVIDAGLWRLRDEFPRRFLSGRLPYLLDRPAP